MLRSAFIPQLLALLFAVAWLPSASATPCESNPCLMGICNDIDDTTFSCFCFTGFWGDYCELESKCGAMEPPCQHGICTDILTSPYFECECYPGYSGYSCYNFDACYSNPCINGDCMNFDFFGYECTCDPEYYGTNCDIPSPCYPNPCNTGACSNAGGVANCTCLNGETGDYCEIPSCASISCQNGGSCNEGEGTCSCSTGYTGDRCQYQTCLNSPCQHGGACSDTATGFSCDCSGTGYYGSQCHVEEQHYCDLNSPCQNNGVCTDDGSDVEYTCDCAGTGFTGPTCATQLTCPTTVESNANWPTTNSGATASGACVAGFGGNPTRQCLLSGSWGAIANPCVAESSECAAETYGNAQWPTTAAGQTAPGTCLPGYEGTTSRKCRVGGYWETSLSGYCFIKHCPAATFDNAEWPEKPAGAVTYGVCVEGYTGRPTRTCLTTGSYGPVSNPCVALTAECPEQTFGNANWPATPVTQTATGTCLPGFSGTSTRTCLSSGTWSTSLNGFCTPKPCPAVAEDNADWPATANGALAFGTCQTGFIGSPKRLCSSTGTWQTIMEPCQPQGDCPQELYARANWGSTAAGETAVGICIAGWNGSPTRICKPNGIWEDLVRNHCQRN